MVVEIIKNMKKERGLSTKELSAISGVPQSTINRLFKVTAKETDPNFRTVARLVKSMGGSLDELAQTVLTAEGAVFLETTVTGTDETINVSALDEEIVEEIEEIAEPEAEKEEPQSINAMISGYTILLENRQRELEGKDRWIKRLFIACCILVGVIVAVLLLDMLNPAIGFFRR